MKKIGLILFASLLVLGYANPTFADAETDRQQSYIAKIQAQNISYSASGLFDAISQDKPELVEMFMQAGMSPNTTFSNANILNSLIPYVSLTTSILLLTIYIRPL